MLVHFVNHNGYQFHSFCRFGGLEKGRFWCKCCSSNLLGAGVLGDSLGALTDSMLGQLTREEETDSSLDLSAGDGGPPVVVGKAGSLSSNTLKDVIHKGVHDGHGLGRDTSVRVNLLQHLVDVDAVAFPPPPLPLLVSSTCGLGLAGGLLGSLGCSLLGWHDCMFSCGITNRNMVANLKLAVFISGARIETGQFQGFCLSPAHFGVLCRIQPVIGQLMLLALSSTNQRPQGRFPAEIGEF